MKSFLATLFFALQANAGGTISIKGTLEKRCSLVDCRLKIGPLLYIIDLTKLSPEQIKTFKSKKTNDEINAFVPSSAVKDVKDIKL